MNVELQRKNILNSLNEHADHIIISSITQLITLLEQSKNHLHKYLFYFSQLEYC